MSLYSTHVRCLFAIPEPFEDDYGDAPANREGLMPLAKRLRLTLIAGLITLLAATGLHVALADSDAGGEAGRLTETLSLHPGDNLVGWVAEPIAVADIFEQIPEAVLIYRWDAESRGWRHAVRASNGTLGNLSIVEPGMAVRVRIEGDKSVEWKRSLTPAKGMVTLYSGVNWVAWNGRDEWPLDQVARGIGKSLVSIEVGKRGIFYQPGDDFAEAIARFNGNAAVRRGDALRVTVNRDLRWLQPTGMMPNIVWVGVPQSLKDKMTQEVAEIVDYFAETHGVEADFSETTILIWHTVEAAVAYQDSNPPYPFHVSGEALRLHLEQVSGGGGIAWGAFAPTGWWRPDPRRSLFKTHLAHELFHTVQNHYTDRWTTAGRPHRWISEGTAVWSGNLGVRIADGQQSFEQTRRDYLNNAKSAAATLRSAEKPNFPWQFQLGLLAVDLLVERSGPDSIVEYFRQQQPQVVGRDRQWQSSPSLDEAFVAAFGLRLDDFYPIFEEWREALPGRRVSSSDELTLRGSLRDADGIPANGFWVNAVPYEGEHPAGRWRRVEVDEVGAFSLRLLRDTAQRVHFERDGCHLWLTDDGLTSSRPQAGQYRDVRTRELPKLDLILPEGICSRDNELRVQVLALRGDDRRIHIILNSEDGQTKLSATHGSSGLHSAFAPKPGLYRVIVDLAGCNLWYRESGLVASRDAGNLVELSQQPVSLEVRIPDDLCIRTISGRLIREDGSPVDTATLYAFRDGLYDHAVWGEDGEFTITVPESGVYRLYVWAGCAVYREKAGATTDRRQATLITVDDEDVTGIEFVVPADPASLCG